MRTATFIILIAALLIPWHIQAAAEPWQEANQQTRHYVAEVMQGRRIPGLQIAVVKNGRVVMSESLGLANVENAIPATLATRFPLNSASKSFTGVAVMQLVQAGKVSLDAPISRYLDDLPEPWNAVRVQQLLAHTSGLPDIVDAQGLVGGGSEQTAWDAITRLPTEAAPGERFAYNQTNYLLLSRIVAARSGIPYADYITTRQFNVVGMPQALFGDSYDLVANAATLYSYFPRRTDPAGSAPRLSHWFYDITPALWAGGGMQATATEVAQWLAALDNGLLLDPVLVQQMWTPAPLNDGSDAAWGAGWQVTQDGKERRVTAMGGARAAFFVYPDRHLAVVVLTNLVGANPQEFIPAIAAFYGPPSP